MIRDRAPFWWSALRDIVEKLGLDGPEQIKDPDIDEVWLWDAVYPISSMCQRAGWIPPELHDHLQRLDRILDRLSHDKTPGPTRPS